MGNQFTTKSDTNNTTNPKPRKMAFYFVEEPHFAMEHYLPYQRQRRHRFHRKPLHQQWINRKVQNQLLNELFEDSSSDEECFSEPRQFSIEDFFQAMTERKETQKPIENKGETTESSDNDETMDVVSDQAKVPTKEVTEVSKVTKLGTKVSVHETMEKVEIKVELLGHKFKAEHLEVKVIDGNVLVIKAEDGEKQFERKFNLPEKCNVEKIESKFNAKEEEKQTIMISIPKDVKIVNIPIAMDE